MQARLDYAVDYDPANASVFATAAAARASVGARLEDSPGAERIPAGTVVTIKSVEQKPVRGKHIVSIAGEGVSGWVVAEKALLPIPPLDAKLTLPASIANVGLLLYGEQDEDDGVSVGVTSHVRFKEFDQNPGNPEYLVTVEDGALAGRSGYLFAAEIEPMPGCSFTLQAQ